jgi:transposase-like protein
MDQKRGSAAARVRHGAAFYRRLLVEQEASGKSLRAFAQERGLSAWTLYGWRVKLGRSRRRGRGAKDAERSAGLVAVDVVGGAQISGDFEVVLSDGLRLRVPRDVAIARLAELVRELRSC